MLHNPYKIVQMFEEEIAHYTGAPYAVSVNSCTNAIFLACKYHKVEGQEVVIPKRTYLSPPQSILQAGGKLQFEDIAWKGVYQLKPFPIYDSKEAVDWYKKARYEGRGTVPYHEDNIIEEGWNMYMNPEQACRGLMLMQNYPEHMEDLPEEPSYRDLTEFDIFKEISVITQ